MRNNFIFLLLLISNIAVSQVYWFYQTERKLGQFGNYNPPSSDTVDYDTIYINWTSFGTHDVNALPWNDADVNNLTALPPATILSNVYSVKGDTLGPLTRTSDTSSSQSWTATATYIYAGWPDTVSQRLVQTDDTMSFNLAGFEPNQEVTFRIFGGGASSAYADEQIVIIGDSVNLVTGLYQQASNELSLAYGTADASGNLSFSMCCPQGGATWAYWKGMEIITGFVEGGTGPEPPPPPPSDLADKIMSANNIDYITDSNEGWEVIYEGTPNTYENHYYQDGYSIFDEKVNDWDGTTFNGILAGEEQRGLVLNYTRGKQTFLNPWQINYYLKMPIQVDSVGYYNNANWGSAGTWNDQWIKVSGANQWGEWITLKDSIRGTDSNQWVWIDVDCPDTLSIIRIQRYIVDMNNLGGNVVWRNPLTMALYGDLDSNSIDTLDNIPNDIYKNGLTYKNRLGVNDVIVTTPDSIGKHFDNVRMYWNLAQMHMKGPVNDTAEKWVISPTAFDYGNVGITGADGNPVRALRHYLQDNLKAKQDAGVNWIVLCMERGLKNLMTDTDISGTNLDISSTYYVEDSADGARWQDGEYIQYTTPYMAQNYDYRQEVYESYHDRTMYVTDPTTPNQNGDLIFSSAGDPQYLPAPTYFASNALNESHPFKGPQVYVNAFNNPSKRDSLMTHPETFSHLAELTFCLGAVFGSNTTIPKAHIDQYLQPGQLYEVGQGLINAIAKHQEPNKTWKGSSGHWKPEWAAMAISTMYDGHLGTACDTCGIWTADTSLYFSMGGDMRLNGSQIIETFNWLKYYRQQVYDTLTSTTHPYNGIEMRVIPKLHFDVHHYWSTMGGQGRDINIIEPSDPVSKAAPPEHPNFLDEQKQFMQWCRKNLPSDARIVCSEYGFGPNSGAPFSIKREDIGVPFPFSSIVPNPSDTINNTGIFYSGDYFWATAERSGGTGADSIDMGPSAYAVALEKRGEQLLWRWGIPYVDKFMSWDPAGLTSYSAVQLNGVTYSAATDWDYWYGMSGNDANKFAYMGFYRKGPPGEVRISDQTYPQVNVSNTMRDYEFWEVETETDAVYSYIWRNTIDTTKYIKRVWRPTLKNDTTYNYTINFPTFGTSDVVQINCYVKSFNPVIDSLGDVTSITEDIIEIEKMFGYTYVPVPTDSISFINGDTSTTIAENTVWQNLGVLSGGVGDYRIDQEYGVGSWLRLRGDTVMNGVTFNYELQYTSNTPPGNPKFKIWDSNDSSQVFTIVVTNVTGAYDQNALIPNQAHADSLNSMIGWNKFQVGDYHIVNNTNANGGIYQLSLPNMGANKNIYISGFFTDVSFVFNNITGRDTSNQVLFSNGLGQFRYDGTFGNINPKGIRFTGKYDQSIRTGDTGYAATVHDTWKHGNFGINRNARHSPVDADFTFAGFNLQKYFSDIEIDHIETHGGGYAGFDLKQDNPKNLTDTGDSVYVVHNLWVHDVYGHELGELIYLGNTKPYPQHFFKNWKIYNILGVRTNYELFQVQRGLGEGHAHNFVGIGAGNWNDAFQVSQGGLFQITPAEPGNLIVEKSISSGGGQDFSILLQPFNNEMENAIASGIINLADTFYSKNSDTVRFRDILVWRARHKGVIYANSIKNEEEIRPDNYASFKAEKIFVSKQQVAQWAEVDTSAETEYFWNYNNWMTNQDAIFDSIIMDTTILGLTDKDFTDTSNIYRLNEVTEPEFENPWAVESLIPSAKSSLTTKLGGQSNWLGFTLDYIHRQSRWTTGVWENAQNIDTLVAKGLPPGYCTLCPIEYKVHDIVSEPVVDTDGQFGHGHYWRLFYCVQDHNSDTGDRPREDTDESHWIELGWVNDRGNYQPLPPDDYNTKVGTFYYNREMGLIEP